MKEELSLNLCAIYDMELSLGNTIIQTSNSEQTALSLTIIFKEPLHRVQIEEKIKILSPIKWYTVGGFAGYVNEYTRQSLQGPVPALADIGQEARGRLSKNLCMIYDLELFLGNTVARVDEPAGSLCPLAIIFKNSIHKSAVESNLSLPPTVKWWESRDPHYPMESGYTDETDCAIAGPLK